MNLAEYMRSEGWKFKLGDYVHKPKGSYWKGHVVGFYSTMQTPYGYCVQLSGYAYGPVQIYPEAALELTRNPFEDQEP